MLELIRLLYLVVVILPLAFLLIGPLLVLASLRGVQRVGPIILAPGRRGVGGRALALLLGLLLWLIVWGGLAMLLTQVRLPMIASVSLSTPTPGVALTLPPLAPTSTPTTVPSLTPQPLPSPTSTRPPMEATPAPPPSPTPSSVSPTPPLPAGQSTVLPTATPTPTPTLPAATPTPVTPTATPTPVATLSPEQTAEAIAAVEAANDLLRAAVIQPSIGSLAALETLWRGEALTKAQAFAQDLYQRYLHPLEVTFAYLVAPVALEGTSSDTGVVISTETWTYTSPRTSHSERLEFTYTLSRQDEGWVITDYAYRYISSSLSSPGEGIPPTIPTPMTITATTVITPIGQ